MDLQTFVAFTMHRPERRVQVSKVEKEIEDLCGNGLEERPRKPVCTDILIFTSAGIVMGSVLGSAYV